MVGYASCKPADGLASCRLVHSYAMIGDRKLACDVGLALDHVNRRLYYTNIGSMTVENEEYSWHKVETVRVDTLSVKVRTVVSSYADRPRAIAVSNG